MAAYLYTISKLYLNSQKNKIASFKNLEDEPKISDLVNKNKKKYEENYETSFLEICPFESESDYNTSEEN